MSNKIYSAVNINRAIIDYAEHLNEAKGCNFDAIGTGGGIDYIVREYPNGMYCVFGDPGDCSSPDTLCDPCEVIIYPSLEAWNDGDGNWMSLTFPTTQAALDAFATGYVNTLSGQQRAEFEAKRFIHYVVGVVGDADLDCQLLEIVRDEQQTESHRFAATYLRQCLAAGVDPKMGV